MCPFGFAANAKSRLRGVCAIIERRKFRGASVPPFVKGLARMPRFMPNATLVFSGLGYAADGPYLLVNDVYGKKQMRLPVLGRTFTLRHTQKRFCIGPFDLKTYQSKACENSVELMPFSQYKDDMCPACREETGFNPAFYNADSISAQQRAYNLTPHFVYMAYFSPQHLKVGISSETRGIERLLEQGARVAGILKRFANADEARALEAHLCAQEGIYETMRLGTKVRLLSDPPLKRCTKRLAPMALNPRAACLTSRNTTSATWKRRPTSCSCPTIRRAIWSLVAAWAWWAAC